MRGALGDRLSDRSACTGRTPRCTEPKKTALQRVRMEEWRTWWFLWMALDGLSLLMEEQQSLCACCGRARRGARLCPEPRWGAVGGHAAAGAKKKGCRVKSAAALRDLARRTGLCSNPGRPGIRFTSGSLRHPFQLFRGIPIRRRIFQSTAVPRHPLRDPIRSPLQVADSFIVIRHAELEAAGRADFVRTCGGRRRPRRLCEVRESADGAGEYHFRTHGECPSCLSQYVELVGLNIVRTVPSGLNAPKVLEAGSYSRMNPSASIFVGVVLKESLSVTT